MFQIPDHPGVYIFRDRNEKVLYIGKAKSLKKRVSGYFTGKTANLKTGLLLKKYNDIDFILTNTEKEALILENNLIKKFRPAFNILLKDDKTYPYIVVTRERFPRVIKVNRTDNISYLKKYGPFIQGKKLNLFIDMINSYFRLRTCRNLRADGCLRKDIGHCDAPCLDAIDEQDYSEKIREVTKILDGDFRQFLDKVNARMNICSERQEYEKAAQLRDISDIVSTFRTDQLVELSGSHTFDIISIGRTENSALIILNRYINGRFFTTRRYEYDFIRFDDLISTFFLEYYRNFEKKIRVYVPDNIYSIVRGVSDGLNIRLAVPRRGEKRKLLELAHTNVMEQMNLSSRTLETLKKSLDLDNMPHRIECYDISNISGKYSVGSMVVFINGFSKRSEYRRFRIQDVSGPDDFASLSEVIRRRFQHTEWDYPQLVVIDGGKGQLSSVLPLVPDHIDVISIAKKEEMIFREGSRCYTLMKGSRELRLIQNLRDEAHRFAITAYRSNHSKNFFNNDIINIKGIGKKTFDKIMKRFSSYDNLSNAGIEELTEVVGKSRARIIYDFFRKEG